MFLRVLKEIEHTLDRINHKLEAAMTKAQTFKDLLTSVDTETNRIAAKIDELVARLTAGGMTDAEETEVLAGLTAVSDKLKGIGADPADPVPA